MKCPYCGKTIAENSVVCIFCEKMLKTPTHSVFLDAQSEKTSAFSPSATIQDTQRIYPPSVSANSFAPSQNTHAYPQFESSRQNNARDIRVDESSLSIAGFIGTLVVSLIPIAGFIVLLVWICSIKTNINRRNLSVALLILKLIVLLFFCGVAFSLYLLNFPFFYYLR